jgi:hypothetical protein
MGLEMVPTQEPVMTARADLVAILEELHDEPVSNVTGDVSGSPCVHAAFARLGKLLPPPITVMLA